MTQHHSEPSSSLAQIIDRACQRPGSDATERVSSFRLGLPVVSAALFAGLLGDLLTTAIVVLRFGPAVEGNPLARWLFVHGGIIAAGALLLALWALASFCLRRIARRRPQRGRRYVLVMANVAALRWLVLIWNLLWLQRYWT